MRLPPLSHTIRLGLRSLAAHRLRSALTALGIVLGVASVIVMLAVGEAARYESLKQLEDLGANTIILRSIKPRDDMDQKAGTDLLAYGLTPADLRRIRTTIPTVASATPMREFRKTLRRLDKKLEARIVSVTPEFMPQNNVRIRLGRGITDLDEQRFDNVTILGASAADILFPTSDPIGKSITIEDIEGLRSYIVVGVTEPKTLAAGAAGGAEIEFDRVAFIPFETDRLRFGRELITRRVGSFQIEKLEISQITVTVDEVNNVTKTAAVIQGLIDQFHPKKDVLVTVPLDLLEKAEQTQQLFTLVLGAIAGVSLVVGGIGIMNIMLATVTERTREIGIRRALGARRRDIAAQFLVETLVLSCGGGVIGVVLGIALSFSLTWLAGLPTIIQLWSPIVAFACSVLVGLASGTFPSRRAALLDPIEALRHE
jgi:putative ABC transport system permease protein